MRTVWRRFVSFLRDVALGIDAAHAVRRGRPAPDRVRVTPRPAAEPAEPRA
ncbi:hypothetical protein [Streptomyces sp. HNM0574]|uniref:hypothetical protein n=1 Tax=Streptomyces sp. HNM0574 TaxID=2714954 RepID=UPI00146F04BA|nr:hypothetical protein [Streptomyces sp. HNM0574]NLU70885.1 hypothetical protein [Streptomyces sp. HNM0574]